MVKPIRFKHDGSNLAFQMQKVDRSRLYGSKELLVHDEDDRPCVLATLAEDGKTLIGKGGTGIGQLTADGKWTDKSKLRPVDLEGNEITPVPSSFAAPIELKHETSIDDFLNHNIRLVYQLITDESSETEEKLVASLRDGAILKFPYSWRGGLEADSGFILCNSEHRIFFLVGHATAAEYVGLQQIVASTDPSEADVDLFDFEMM